MYYIILTHHQQNNNSIRIEDIKLVLDTIYFKQICPRYNGNSIEAHAKISALLAKLSSNITLSKTRMSKSTLECLRRQR